MTADSVLTYRPKKIGQIAPILVSIMLVIMGISTILGGDSEGWIMVAIFCVTLIINVAIILPNASYIRLSSEGIEIRSFFRSWFVKWYEIEQFGYGEVKGKDMIVIKYSANHTGNQTLKNLGKAISGAEGGFDTLGNPPEEMVNVLNEWKEKYAGKRHN